MIRPQDRPLNSFPSFLSDPAAQAASDLWAKFPKKEGDGTEESIPVHTACALTVLLHLRTRYENLLGEGEQFWKDLFVALLFHDAGKFVRNFQVENRKPMRGNGRDWDKYIRHEFISCILLLSNYEQLVNNRPEAFFAVAGHHKALTKGIYTEHAKSSLVTKILDYREEDLLKITNWLQGQLQEIGIAWTFDGEAAESLALANGQRLQNLYDWFHAKAFGVKAGVRGFIHNYQGSQAEQKRLRYARFMGLLHAADWGGSGHQLPSEPLSFSEVFLKEHMRRTIGESFKDWRKFQRDSLVDGDVLAIAPTGSGKTEAALLWASQRPAGTRTIYCLPTKVTSNAIYQRIKKIMPLNIKGRETVGVVHSGAKNFRILDDDNYDDRDYLTDKSFGRDITVCTVDQLLTVGFNLGHWQMKTLHLTGASIVIDEIHLYQPYTLGLIIGTITYLKKYCGVRFYIMTATMPEKLQQLLRKTLGETLALIVDTEKQDQARNTWLYVSEKLSTGVNAELNKEGLNKKIQQDIKSGKKVLIVRNTVDSCVATYNAFRSFALGDNHCCLHSRFTQKDRLAKEEVVINLNFEKPFLLVSTQVVEVSLDIDFDVLYTENAPIDALIQRAGRVNRKGRKEDTEVVVFAASENSVRMYGEEIEDVLERTMLALQPFQGERIVEADMIDLVNEVYADYEVTSTPSYREGKVAHQRHQKAAQQYILDTTFGDDENQVYTREGIDSVAVIPKCFKYDLAGKSLAEKSQYLIPISKKQFHRLIHRELDDDPKHGFLIYVDSDYTTETGLYIPTWSEITNPNAKTLFL